MTPLTRNQVRRIDRYAIEQAGVPGVVLMENAGRNAADVVMAELARRPTARTGRPRAAIFCGGGNNGGDGYVIARHLHNAGVGVTVYAIVDPDRLTGDAAVNHRICQRTGLDIRLVPDDAAIDAQAPGWRTCDVLVDAMLGTGFTGQVRPHMAAVIRRLREIAGPTVVAIDVPSGLDCDTGLAHSAVVRADVTVTFVASKVGFEAAQAKPLVGRVVVVGIGVSDDLARQALDAVDED